MDKKINVHETFKQTAEEIINFNYNDESEEEIELLLRQLAKYLPVKLVYKEE